MEESEKELECKNCGKMITESKFDLHEAYCLRNIIRCTKCNEPINKNEVEEHNEQFHTPVQCQYCKQQFEKPKLEDHLKICNCQPQICTFCQLPISKKEIYIHEKQCGSRTEICEYCKSRIQLNQLDEHKIYCKINEEMKKEEQKYEKQFPALNEQKSSKPKSQISPQIHKPQSKASKKDQKSVPQMKQSNKPQQQYQQKQEQKAANKKQNLYEEMLAHTFQSNGNYGASSQEFAEQFNKQQLDAIAYDQMNQFNFPQDQDYQEKYSNVYDALENINPQPGFEESIFSSQQKQHQQQQKLHKPKLQQNQEQLPKSQIQKEISQDDDEMIQRVIEMSLQDGWKQPVVGDLGSTMDSEAFKRALEKSKYEK